MLSDNGFGDNIISSFSVLEIAINEFGSLLAVLRLSSVLGLVCHLIEVSGYDVVVVSDVHH